MKKIKLLLFVLILALTISFEVIVFAEDDTFSKYGREVCSWITDTEENKDIKSLAKEGKYEEAIELYRVRFLEFCKSLPDDFFSEGFLEARNTTYADALMSDKEDIANQTDQLNVVRPYVLGKVGSYDWDVKTLTMSHEANWMQGFSSFRWIKPLVAEYLVTGDKAYMDKYFAIFRDFDEKFVANKARYDAYSKADLRTVSRYFDPLPTQIRWMIRFNGFIQLAKYDFEALEKSFTNEDFVHMLRAFNNQNNYTFIRMDVANQMLAGITATVQKYLFFQDLQYEIDYLPYIGDTFKIYLNKSYLPDGQDSEMSFNYNWGFIRNLYSIVECSKYFKNEVQWIEDAKKYMQFRYLSMLSLTSPQKMLPNIGHNWSTNDEMANIKTYGGMLIDLNETNETADRIVNNIHGDASVNPPEYTSIGFPYVGYYVMRDGWEEDSQYVFFKGGRMTGTHYDHSALGIIYNAFGERLLIDAGPSSYQEDTLEIGKHLMSSFAHNTVSVAQQSQVIHRGTDIADLQVINDALWYTSDTFDVVKDDYINGYAKEVMEIWDQKKDTTGVIHERIVINDKENTLTLVVDDMLTKGDYQYEQNWNFAYKFADYGSVICDADEKFIKTNLNDNKAGVELYAISDKEVTYEINSGELKPDRGWYQTSYGVDYYPGMHVQLKWKGSKNSSMATLINPTDKGISQIKNREYFADGKGVKVSLLNGNTVYIISSETGENEFSLGDLYFKGKTLYLIEKPDKTIKAIAYGTTDLSYKSETVRFEKNKFEFECKDGKLTIKDVVQAPKKFEWKNTENGYIPEYGFNTKGGTFQY